MNPITAILKNSTYLVVAKGANVAIRVGYVIALAHFLGPEDYGLYQYALGFYLLFMPLTSLGLWAVISHDVGESETKGKETVQATYSLRILLSVLAAFCCSGLGFWLHEETSTRIIISIFAIGLVGRALATWQEHVFNAYSLSKNVLRLELVFRPLEAVCCIALLLRAPHLSYLAIVHSMFWWIQALVGWRLIIRDVYQVSPLWNWAKMKPILSSGLWMGAAAFLLAWFGQGPLMIAKQLEVDPVQLGQLALLLHVFNLLGQLPRMIRMAALPVLSRTDDDVQGLKLQFLKTVLNWSWLCCGLATMVCWVVGPSLVEWVLGDEYLSAGKMLFVSLYLLLPWTWGNLLWTDALSKWNMKSSALLILMGSLVMTLSLGVVGARLELPTLLFSMGVGMWCWVCCMLVQAREGFRLFVGQLLATLLVGALMASSMPVWMAFILGVFILLGIFLYGTHSRDERKRLATFLKGILKPSQHV